MKAAHKILALVVALSLPMAAAGQDDEAIDDIVVTGEKSTADLRRDLVKAEDEFYSLYNELNDDNDYDVRCRWESPTGVRKKYQVCRPVFYSEARNRRENLNRPIDPATDPVLAERLETLQEKMESLVATNPDLQVAMVNYNTARSRLAAQLEGESGN